MEAFIGVIDTYKLKLPLWLTRAIAVMVVLFELVLGIVILSGKFLDQAALWSVVMHAGYAVLLTITLLRRIPLKNCGCFGVFFPRPLRWYTPLEDVVMIILSLLLFFAQ